MSRFSLSFALAAVLAVGTFGPVRPLSAQSIWADPWRDRSIALEILKPNFQGDDPTTFATSALFFSFRWPLSETLLLVTELPLAHAAIDDPFFGDESATTLGNPYVGVEVRGWSRAVSVELGLRAPLTSAEEELAWLTAMVSDVDRWEAFAPDVVPITGILTYRHASPSGFGVQLRGGPAVWIQAGDAGPEDGAELFALYGVQALYEVYPVTLAAAFTGRAVLTEMGDFGSRTVHQLGLGAAITLGRVMPNLQIRVPVDEDFGDLLDYTIGLGLAVQIR